MGMGNEKKGQPKGLFTNVEMESTIVDFPNKSNDLDRIEGQMKNISVQLPNVLQRLMKAKPVSVRQLSKDLGGRIPVSTLSSYLGGRKASYSPDHLQALAEYFDVSVDFLLFGQERSSGINALLTELVYDGWLRVKIERAVPTATASKKKLED